jgi:CRP-like cAMP-binding protein
VAIATERLQAVPLFSELGRKDLKSLASTMRERTYRAGETVTDEGEGGIGFFVIDTGEAEVSVEGHTRAVLGPGDHFGEIALLADAPRTATITATTDLHCFGLTSWQFKPLVQNDADVAWKLLQGLAKMMAART